MNIEWFMAARARIVYNGQVTLAGALLGKADVDPLVMAIEQTFHEWLGNGTHSCIDAIETIIAELVDQGSVLPISNPETMGLAQWFAAESDLLAIPDPMPRRVVLYLAKAFHDVGKYPTMAEALGQILSTKHFF